MEPMGSTVISGELQLDATSEEHWTTDEDAIDTPGMTRTPNSPVLNKVLDHEEFLQNRHDLQQKLSCALTFPIC